MSNNLQPVRLTEIQIGQPLAWTVYDKSGRLLLREGAMIVSQRQIEGISASGMFRQSSRAHVARQGGGGGGGAAGAGAAAGEESDAGKSAPVEKPDDLISIKLAIGDTVQLQDFSSDKNRYFVKLIGFMNKKSVLVSHPRQDEQLSFIKEGHGFLVRGFSGTKTYEFSSNVLSVCLTPYPYLHLAYPSQVKATNMRSAVRIKLRLVCSIESAATGLKVPAIIEDVSISGARIHAKAAFGQVGDAVTVGMRIQIGGENQVFLVSSVIRNVHLETDSQTSGQIVMHGMQFVEAADNDLTMLQNYIYKSMLES